MPVRRWAATWQGTGFHVPVSAPQMHTAVPQASALKRFMRCHWACSEAMLLADAVVCSSSCHSASMALPDWHSSSASSLEPLHITCMNGSFRGQSHMAARADSSACVCNMTTGRCLTCADITLAWAGVACLQERE